jgi:methionyl-tRNA formyltransferase
MDFELVTGVLDSVRQNRTEFETTSQQEIFSTYWPRLNTFLQAWIDWRWDADQIERFICAFDDPYSGAQTMWRGNKVGLKKAVSHYEDGLFHPFQAGIVYRKNANWLCIATNRGSIVAEKAIDQNGSSMMDQIKVGDYLYTLEDALSSRSDRVTYTPNGLKS